MIIVRRMLVSIASLLAIIMLVLLVSRVHPRVQVGAEPVRNENDRIRLDHGLVVLEQHQMLEGPPPTELTLRLWVQQLPSYYPYLTVRGAIGQSRIGPIDVALPPPDGKFHMIELPWWRVPANAESVYLKLRGHGVLIETTLPSNTRPALQVSGIARPELSLALQMVERQTNFEYYFPLLRIADGKPALLGYPQLLLLLGAAFFAMWGILIGLIPYLLRAVLQLHDAARRDDATR